MRRRRNHYHHELTGHFKPARTPFLHKKACHFEQKYVRNFECLTELGEWYGTHHPNSHLNVPTVRVWDDSCDEIHMNKYGTSARYATVGARARDVRRPCGHNEGRATTGAKVTHLRMHNAPQRTMDAGNDIASITIVEWNGRVQLFILSTHESRSLTSSQQCYLIVKPKRGTITAISIAVVITHASSTK